MSVALHGSVRAEAGPGTAPNGDPCTKEKKIPPIPYALLPDRLQLTGSGLCRAILMPEAFVEERPEGNEPRPQGSRLLLDLQGNKAVAVLKRTKREDVGSFGKLWEALGSSKAIHHDHAAKHSE